MRVAAIYVVDLLYGTLLFPPSPLQAIYICVFNYGGVGRWVGHALWLRFLRQTEDAVAAAASKV